MTQLNQNEWKPLEGCEGCDYHKSHVIHLIFERGDCFDLWDFTLFYKNCIPPLLWFRTYTVHLFFFDYASLILSQQLYFITYTLVLIYIFWGLRKLKCRSKPKSSPTIKVKNFNVLQYKFIRTSLQYVPYILFNLQLVCVSLITFIFITYVYNSQSIFANCKGKTRFKMKFFDAGEFSLYWGLVLRSI